MSYIAPSGLNDTLLDEYHNLCMKLNPNSEDYRKIKHIEKSYNGDIATHYKLYLLRLEVENSNELRQMIIVLCILIIILIILK